MEFKEFELETGIDEKGLFTGKLTVYGEVDSYNDVVVRGAFSKTLKEKRHVSTFMATRPCRGNRCSPPNREARLRRS